MKPRRHARTILAVVAGIALGSGIVVAAEAVSEDPPSPEGIAPRPSSSAASTPALKEKEPVRTILLAWTPGGMPAGSERRIEAIPGVRDATTIVAGLEWIKGAETADGTATDSIDNGMGIPFEVAVIEPNEYARFVSPAEEPLVRALSTGWMLIPETEARLRGSGIGLRVATSTEAGQEKGLTIRTVAGVVGDRATNGYEALVSGPVPPEWPGTDRFVLARLKRTADPKGIEAQIRGLLGPGRRLRVRLQGESPYLRYGDAVLPQLIIKENFGEFAAAPLGDGTIQIDDRWRRSSIRSGPVPVLGTVTCHRRVFGQLRSALAAVRSAGLSYLIDPRDYGGCFSPRFVASSSGPRLSHHSWGIAIDLNVAENAFGTKPDQDPRLVRIFEQHGFTWGGRWLIPDGMHFEWARFP